MITVDKGRDGFTASARMDVGDICNVEVSDGVRIMAVCRKTKPGNLTCSGCILKGRGPCFKIGCSTRCFVLEPIEALLEDL